MAKFDLDLNQFMPDQGRAGLRVRHLTFKPHILAEEAARIENIAETMPMFADMLTAMQAVVIFANHWGLSLVTYTPSDTHPLLLLNGDARIPTYEVAIFDPDQNLVEVFYHLEIPEIEQLMRDTMAQDYVGGRLGLER